MIFPESPQAERIPQAPPEAVDFQRFFEALSGLFLVLNRQLQIVAMSDAYARATRIRREEVLGKGVFEVFPEDPGDPDANGVQNCRASFLRVLLSGTAEIMPIQRYDARRPEKDGGGFEERYWSPLNSPVLAEDGSVQWILHRVEDVTEYVQLAQQNMEPGQLNEALRGSASATLDLLKEAIAARKDAEEAREYSAALARRLQALLQALPVGIAFSEDPSCERIGGNPALLAQFDMGASENVSASAVDPAEMGRSVRYFHQGRELTGSELPMQRAVALNALIAPMELEVELPSGRRWFAEVSGAPVRDAEGAVIGGMGMVKDISWRKQAERTLRENEERFRQVTEAIEQVFWMTDVAHEEILYISPGYERIWGVSCQSLYDSPSAWLDAIHPEDRPSVLKAALNEQAAGRYDVEYRIARPDGTERWIRDRAFPIRDEEGKVYRVAGVADDITSRKQAEAALRGSEAQLHAADHRLAEILHGMSEACFALDSQWRFTFVNERYLTLVGHTRAAMLGRMIWEMIPTLVGTPIEDHYRRALCEQRPIYFEVISPSDQRWRDVRVFPSGGGLAVFLLDIHARKLAEEAFRESAAEVGRSIQLLEAQIAERARLEGEILEISEREQRRLGQDLHDGLGQELAGIAMLNLVLSNRLQAEAHPGAKSAADIATYTNEALHSSRRLAKGLYPVELSRHGLLAALEDLAQQIRQRFGIDCQLRQSGQAGDIVESAAIHIYRIVQECIGNAIKHARARYILVESLAGEDHHTFTVTNDGVGFEKPASTSGMGLHLMSYRARLIGAELSIEQPAQGGCRVLCRLPVRSVF